jgi:hypothetical protein
VWLAAAPVLVLLCYLPVVLIEYGFSEDYRQLAAYDRGATFQPLMIAEGRPLFALWARAVFSLVGDIPSLRWVRLANILLFAGLAFALSRAWKRAGWAAPESAMAGVAALTLPPFQLFAGTAAMGAVAVASLFGAGAAFVARASGLAPGRAGRVYRGTIAFALLVAGLATYQPGGLIFWAFAGIFLIAPNPSRPEFRRGALTFAAVGALALAAEFAIFLAGRNAFRPWLLDAPRADLTIDPVAKTLWFLFHPLPHALNLWKLNPDLLLAFAMMIALPTAIALHLRHTQDRAARALFALLLLPLCYLPNLAVIENRSSFRSLSALAVIVLVFYLIAFRGQLAGPRRKLFHGLLAAASVLGIASAVHGSTRLIALPQARELAIVRRTLAAVPGPRFRLAVVPAGFRDALAPAVLYDEFGYPSTALPWSTHEMTYLVLREFHPEADTAALRPVPHVAGDRSPFTIVDWGAALREAARR